MTSNTVQQLIQQLEHAEMARRIDAAQQLATMGTDASLAVLPLIGHLDAPEESLREWSSAALEECGAPHVSDLSSLLEYLETPSDHSPTVLYWVLTLIGRLEKQASEATLPLCRFIERAETFFPSNRQDEETRGMLGRAVWALAKTASGDDVAKQTLLNFKELRPELTTPIDRALQNF